MERKQKISCGCSCDYSSPVIETGYWGQEVCVLHCSFCMYNRLLAFKTTMSCVPLCFLSAPRCFLQYSRFVSRHSTIFTQLRPFLHHQTWDRCGRRRCGRRRCVRLVLWMYNRLFVLKVTVRCAPLLFQRWERKRACLFSCRSLRTAVIALISLTVVTRVQDTRDRHCSTSVEHVHSLPSDHVKLTSLQSSFRQNGVWALSESPCIQ